MMEGSEEMQRGKFIALNAYIKKREKYQMKKI